MIDMSEQQKILIDQWWEYCKKGNTPEESIVLAQQYMVQNSMYDPAEVYKGIECIMAVCHVDINTVCQSDAAFAGFIKNAKNAVWAQEMTEKNRLLRAKYQDTAGDIRRQLAGIDDVLLNSGTPALVARLFSNMEKTINKMAADTKIEPREIPFKGMFSKIGEVPEGYRCGVFGYKFPVETLSFIGARTSRGKTAAMTSIAIDAVFPLKHAEDKRKVLFISLEESNWQIAQRLALCKAWRDADTATQKELLNVVNPYYREGEDSEYTRFDPKETMRAWMRGNLKSDTPANTAFINALNKAMNEIIAAGDSGDISVFDGAGVSLLELQSRLNSLPSGSIVLYDYIQLSPAAGGITDSYSKKTAVADADTMIITAVKAQHCIAIAGAQFNRNGTDSQHGDTAVGLNQKVDSFGDTSFSDCGNIEQDAHLALGIGWIKSDSGDVTDRFYEVLKNRAGGGVGSQILLDVSGIGYSCIKSKHEPLGFKATKEDKSQKKKEATKKDTMTTTRRRDTPPAEVQWQEE